MKSIFILLACAFIAHAEMGEDDVDESLHGNDNKNVYVEIPAVGNAFAFLFPSRVLSLKVDVSRNLGLLMEPIAGHNVIKGIGSTAGFYYRDGKNYNGLKYVFIDVSRYGALNEVFYDYDRYLNTSPGFNLRFGFSAGVGMTKFNENRQESRISIDYGPTFRLHLDLSYLIKYN